MLGILQAARVIPTALIKESVRIYKQWDLYIKALYFKGGEKEVRFLACKSPPFCCLVFLPLPT